MSARKKKQVITPDRVLATITSDGFEHWFKNNLRDHLDPSAPMRVSRKKILADVSEMFGLEEKKK